MFRLPEEVKEDLKKYKASLEEEQKGKISQARFRGIRVPWGIYSHRGGKVFMNRIRIPAGVINPSQLKALASAAKRYGRGILHITTRQDIQIHDVKIEDTIKVMEYLKEYDLSPRGGGGNTVRNVIACPLSGLCRNEIFDVRGYAIAISEYLLRQESSFNLPRKFKIAFSCCPKDCAGCIVNDLGFLAKKKGGKIGFKVYVGGGMGAQSRLGRLLEEFISEKDLGYCISAVKNVYYKKGDRRNKHHNRLRFLIEDIGYEGFRNFYDKELEELKKTHIVLRKIDFPEREEKDTEIPKIENEEYNQFLRYSINPQKQKGFSSVQLRIPRGDITSEELNGLALLEKDFPGIEFCTSQNQNIFITWVKNRDMHKLFLKLKTILSDFLYPQTLLDVVACKGALTCNMGLCNSPGLAKEIEDIIKKFFLQKKVFDKLEIRLNGCPNACGQQPIGKLSFYGLVRRVDNRPVPFYKFLIGGRKEEDKTKFANDAGNIPAKNIPKFLREFLNKAEERLKKGDDIYSFLENGAMDLAKKILEDLSFVPSYKEDKGFYIDWGKEEEFSLAGIGPGECGAGVIDMIESDLTEAEIALEEAEIGGYSIDDIKRALFYSSRALLVVKGEDPRTEKEALSVFKEKFIDEGIASSDYSDIKDVFEAIKDTLKSEERKDKFTYAKGFCEHINEIYKSMDTSFSFPKGEEKKKEERRPSHTLDLKGTPCPINYVKAKLFLENLNSGDILDIFLDEGEPIDNVPKSLKDDGHHILKIEKLDGFYKIVVKKK